MRGGKLLRSATVVWLARGMGALACLGLLAIDIALAGSSASRYLNSLGLWSVLLALCARLALPERWREPIVRLALLIWLGVFAMKLSAASGFIREGSPWVLLNKDLVVVTQTRAARGRPAGFCAHP